MTSSDLEVQERASTSLQILKYVQKIRDKGEEIFEEEMKTFFAGELNPVGPKASDKHGDWRFYFQNLVSCPQTDSMIFSV